MVNADYLKNLNEAQIQAVTHLKGPLLIVAGAGSGKTKVLTSRMSETQLKTFNNSYDEKIKFGKLVYSKNLKNKPQT